ncbi:MAG: biotin--[acetyl-CoA-carboxylase] ligase [Bacilli bacterium]
MVKNKILEYFFCNNKQATLSFFAKEFNVSRNACWLAINKLVEDGYDIKSDGKKGYIYFDNDKLSAVEINQYCNNFKCIEVLNSVDSTSNYLKRLDILSTNIIVASDEQTSGRGQRGKNFLSKKGNGAYFTIYLKESFDIDDIKYITICSAVAIRRCLHELYKIDVDIKWLNDIFYKNKKLGGILTEVTVNAEEHSVSEIYVGIGINTLRVDDEIEDIAISIEEISGNKVNRSQLIANVVNYFDQVFMILKQGESMKILNEYKLYQFIIGKKVLVREAEVEYTATVDSINNDAMLVVNANGIIKVLNNATIRVKEVQNES